LVLISDMNECSLLMYIYKKKKNEVYVLYKEIIMIEECRRKGKGTTQQKKGKRRQRKD
jgi:hypothetical protein